MKLDLKEGMYFRTKSGTINKIDSLTDDKSEFYFDTKPIYGAIQKILLKQVINLLI